MKKKTLAGLISSLICISLIGVGFASWVITGDATAEQTGGTITAESIADESLGVTITGWDSTLDATIDFGAVKTSSDSLTKIWLTNNSVAEKEDLVSKVDFTVEHHEHLNGAPTATVTVVDNASAWKNAKDAGLVVDPVANVEGSAGSYSVTITFAWGAHFNSKNPYVFYNEQSVTDELKQDALTNMELVEALSKCTFKVNITATAK